MLYSTLNPALNGFAERLDGFLEDYCAYVQTGSLHFHLHCFFAVPDEFGGQRVFAGIYLYLKHAVVISHPAGNNRAVTGQNNADIRDRLSGFVSDYARNDF